MAQRQRIRPSGGGGIDPVAPAAPPGGRALPPRVELPFTILPQPNDETCGPTCLHAVYRYYEDPYPLERIIDEVEALETGGTLAVLLANHALRRGYAATIYTYNLDVFDPTWFIEPGVDLADRLRRRRKAKRSAKLRTAVDGYLAFLALGGVLRFRPLEPGFLRSYLKRGQPILTGLSATYLYGCAREREIEADPPTMDYDDVAGDPTGHFVVLSGYDSERREVTVADPFPDNPRFQRHVYSVAMQRLLGAVMLGALTYDANLLIIQPRSASS